MLLSIVVIFRDDPLFLPGLLADLRTVDSKDDQRRLWHTK